MSTDTTSPERVHDLSTPFPDERRLWTHETFDPVCERHAVGDLQSLLSAHQVLGGRRLDAWTAEGEWRVWTLADELRWQSAVSGMPPSWRHACNQCREEAER